MFQGTGSDVGKSLLVAGLCRAAARRGLTVRPFKPQNMSNNAAVTADGGEIGRAQALQARACGVPASVDMNPVLLKPQSETGAQLVVRGAVRASADARAFQEMKAGLRETVLQSYRRLEAEADLVLVEGAGSPAEINLRAADLANMGFAEAADLPVVLIGDIDRGGVIAALVGTHAVLAPTERDRVAGFLINKFRGDVSLFADGLTAISARTGWPALGIVPWFEAARRLPAEDAVALERATPANGDGLHVAVLRLSRIANFDDLDPLAAEPGVRLNFVAPGEALPGDADLVILPGSKATRADLAFLRAQGWDLDIRAHLRRGGRVLGLCGGYQMLGRSVRDPGGTEGPAGESEGLGLLPVDTVLQADKTVREVAGRHLATGERVRGYEIHVGESRVDAGAPAFLQLGSRSDGAVSADGRVAGCYLHGLFAEDGFRRAFLERLRPGAGSPLAWEAHVDETLDSLADHLERHVAVDRVLAFADAA